MGCSGLKVTESCWFSVVCAINVTAIFRHLNRVFRILNYCLCLHSYQYLNLTKTLPKKDKTIIFEQGWRTLHMYLLHFQSSTLTSPVDECRCLLPLPTPISPEAHKSPCNQWQRGPQQDFSSLLLSVHFSLKQGPADRALSMPDLLPAGWPTVTLTHCWNS